MSHNVETLNQWSKHNNTAPPSLVDRHQQTHGLGSQRKTSPNDAPIDWEQLHWRGKEVDDFIVHQRGLVSAANPSR
ncbi:MAG: hypothetical protein ACFE0J_03700 [Elainellaceae cyanobacterium]